MTVLIFLFPGFIIGLLLLFYPVVAIWTMLVTAMAVTGTVTYFLPQFAVIRWAIVPMSLALILRALLSGITYTPERSRFSPPFFILGLFLLFTAVTFTTIMNFHIKETLVSSKNFFQFWSIPLAFTYVVSDRKIASQIMMGLLCISIFQPLLALIQYMFFTGNFPGDSITGTFGGQMAGGGPNSALSIYMTIQIAAIITFAKKNLLKRRFALLLTLWFLIPIFLSHAKITAFYFPVIFFTLYGKDLLKKTFVGLVILLLFIGMGFSVFHFHYSQSGQYSVSGKKTESFESYIKQILSYNIAEKQREKKLSRLASIYFWWNENSIFNSPARTFMGHGLGAAKHSGLLLGHLNDRPRYKFLEIGRFALPRLLWDLGLIGTALFILIYASAFFTAGRLKNNPCIPSSQQAFLTADQIACLLFIITLPYKISIINVQAFNAYSMFILGHIAFWAVEANRQKAANHEQKIT